MTDTSADIAQRQEKYRSVGDLDTYGGGDVGDYIALLKPRVMSLSIFTALVGMVCAPESLHPVLSLTALLCIAVGAGASGALNMWYDADIDGQMQRTAARPIPRGRISPSEALSFGAVLAVGSILSLGLLVNWVAAALLALTIGFYLFIYTMWLKRSTPQNIVIGGAAGAFPPMVGWAAATGSVSLESIVLFLLIFMWTPPHFWALSLYRCRDYERVGIPMMPVVHGERETLKQILLYSLAMVPVGILPAFVGLGGTIYAVVATLMGGWFLWLTIKLCRTQKGTERDKAAKQLFLYSILYLFSLFAVMLVENSLLKAGFGGWIG